MNILKKISALCIITGFLLTSNTGLAETIEGTLTLTNNKRNRAKVSDAILYFQPSKKLTFPTQTREHIMSTKRKRFIPRVLPINVGSYVSFPNNDVILHNAFSKTKGNIFDIGVIPTGPGKKIQFLQSGLIRVFCNVHHHMVGYIYSLDTPYWVQADKKGAFKIENIGQTKGKLTVWHEKTKLWTKNIAFTGDLTLDIEIPISKRRLPTHLNKFGKPYKRSRRRKY